jgi:uncharacterized protein YprB with RNaseH-like and TPR domain
MPDIKQELTKLGFVPAKNIAAVKTNRTTIEDAVQGIRIINEFGEVIMIEMTYPYETIFGSSKLSFPSNFGIVRKIIKHESITNNPQKYIYIDTETTGLSGGTGTLPFLIGYGFFTPGGFTVQQLLSDSPINEITQLLEFNKTLQNFETTMTFNGKSFDLPLIKTRFVINKIDPPLDKLNHIDLLHISRNIWKMRLADRSLRELESRILGFSRTDDDIPGWMIPQVYFDFLKTGDPSELKGVVYHNRIDVLCMAVLHQKVISMIENINKKDENDILDSYSIGVIFQNRYQYSDALCVFNRCINASGINDYLLVDLHMRVAQINKRQNNWDSAIFHWVEASELGSIDSCVELAKYYEHNLKSLQDALFWALKAKALLIRAKKKVVRYTERNDEIAKRIERLQRRK